jgi:predicted alpha/beta-hydrolase family hydrolase
MSELLRKHLKVNNAKGAPTLLLTHGAGAAMDTPFMDHIAKGVAKGGVRVVRFEFDYMRRRRESGKKGGPDRADKLLACFRRAAELAGVPPGELYIGGKSMGGRMATMVADELGVAGVVALGYPFHPPGKPEKLRTEHLEKMKTRALILQGERDTFGTRDEVKGYKLSKKIRVCWLADGDHSLKPRKKSGRSEEQNLDEAVAQLLAFARG